MTKAKKKEQEQPPPPSGSIIADVLGFFSSVRTTIGLLCLLAAASILGTVIPQNVDPEQIRQSSSPFVYRLVMILDLSNVYRSWWFILLLVLLTGNLLGCLIQRLPKIPGEWRGAAGTGSLNFTVSDGHPPAQLKDIISQAIMPLMGNPSQVVQAGDEIRLAWVKQRVFLLAFPLIHISIIVILVGGLIGLFYGVKGNMQLREGETGREFTTFPTNQVKELPFDVAVDKFVLERYPTGQPKEYRSDVRFIKNGKELLKGSIVVNHPLSWEGISLYQANYQMLGIKQVKLAVVKADGTRSEIAVEPGETAALPGTGSKIRLASLDPGSTARGPGVEISVEEEGSAPRLMKVFRNDAEPVKLSETGIRFLDYEPLYATGLQIGYDPGTNVVWVGCILLIVGFSLTLFTNLSGVTVTLKAQRGGTKIRVTGRSKKDRAEFRKQVETAVHNCLEGGKAK